MSRLFFYAGITGYFLVFLLILYVKDSQTPLLDHVAYTFIHVSGCVVLAYLGWLASRWQSGHWEANALNPSPQRRRFIFYGTLFISFLFLWSQYLDFTDRFFW